jgi:predicted DNA-binding antitoxin AbrB/MazE fold protein
MFKAVRGVYKNGVIELLEDAEIVEGTEATITFNKITVSDETIKRLKRWKQQGLISSFPNFAREKKENEPVKIKGEPLSQTVIENRGGK